MDASALTLHQLKIFHTVARTGNLTRAAEQLGISQPAVSIQIKQLERILGLPLIEPCGRGQKLTQMGEVVDEHALRILAQVEGLAEAVMDIRGVEGGQLVVGADTTVGIYVMPQLLGAWHHNHPQVEVDLRVANHDAVCQLLRNNEVDVAVVSTIPRIPHLDVESFLPNRLVIIAPPDHALAQRNDGNLPAALLAQEPFLVREGGSSTRAAMEAFCRQAGVELRIAMQLGSIGAIKQGVASGLGLGVVSERAIGNELEVGALVVLNIEGFPIELTWYIVHRKEKRLSPAARSFKQYLQTSRDVLEEPRLKRAASRVVPQGLKEEVSPRR